MARPDPAQGIAVDPQGRPPAGSPIPNVLATVDPLDVLWAEEARRAPSLPIVLLSAAFGLSAAMIGFYVAYGIVQLRVEVSAAVATLFLCFGVGISGAVLSFATGSRAALPNISLSCGLVVLTLLFLGMCVFVGALAATLLIAVRV